MKRIILTLFVACAVCCAVQAQVFVIERGSNAALTFDNIKAAVDALQDNDRLYLPPGEINLTGYTWTGYNGDQNHSDILVIRKKVAIYGAGYNDGANSTFITGGKFMIGKGADGSLIIGIRFENIFQLDNVSNCIVMRCRTDGVFFLDGIGSSINVLECYVNSDLGTRSSNYTSPSGNGLTASFSKCIFNTPYISFKNGIVSNSLFLRGTYSTSNYSSFLNNIIILSESVTNYDKAVDASNCSYSHNLWVGGYPASDASNNNTFTNEKERESYANVFVDPNKGDYHLKAECIGKNAGSDGTDVGIYGTAIPFKESKLPSIPHFSVKLISPETDATGKLPVNIKIEAQDN